MKEKDQYIREFGYIFAPEKDRDAVAAEIRRQVGQAMAFDPGTERILSRLDSHPELKTDLPHMIVGVGVGLELDFIPEGASVVGVDTNREILEVAELRAKNLGQNLRTVVGDGMAVDNEVPDHSLGSVRARLLFQHNKSADVPVALQGYREKLNPSGFFYGMDLDASTWVMEPACEGFTRIMDAVDKMYEVGGRDRNIGGKLSELLDNAGYDILEEDVYEIQDPTRQLHLQTLKGMGRGVVHAGIMSEEKFAENYAEVDRKTSTSTVRNPTVYQYIAVPKKA